MDNELSPEDLELLKILKEEDTMNLVEPPAELDQAILSMAASHIKIGQKSSTRSFPKWLISFSSIAAVLCIAFLVQKKAPSGLVNEEFPLEVVDEIQLLEDELLMQAWIELEAEEDIFD